MLRVIDQIRPTWVVGENVAGITTMVESCEITDLGGEATLFEKNNGVHRFRSEHTFTIERICRDLESKGYSIQPMLIPACAVGAPHRRDRIFIIAHNTDCSYDLRKTGKDESKSSEERLPEWNAVRKFGESSDVRSEMQSSFTDTYCDRGREVHQYLQSSESDGQKPLSNGGIGIATDTTSGGSEPFSQSQGIEGHRSNKIPQQSKRRDQTEFFDGLLGISRSFAGLFTDDLKPGERWTYFPSVSPVHGGNDGFPFDVDNLSIPFAKWRAESLKAYGNAIVPQVMYRIFECIDKLSYGNH
jgi:DNA (cytosine-5)-methyltransferase 1